jgi:ribosomal protein S12 methylthiotransferase
MAGLLDASGYQAVAEARDAQVLIVNTCGFIGPAKQESVNALRELAGSKHPGQILIAAGCLSQRYGAALARAVPGLEGIIGTRRWMDIVDLVTRLRRRRNHEPIYHLPETGAPPSAPPAQREGNGADDYGAPRAAVQGRSAYLKIADGCRRPCAFCAIPLIKGPAVSRPPERIIAEARQLIDAGVQEILLIAQDTTDYGTDLGLRDGLATLLEQLATAVPDARWIRLMYAYPGAVTPADRRDGRPSRSPLPGHSAATRPSRRAAAHAPPGQRRMGIARSGCTCARLCPTWRAHDVHRATRRNRNRVRGAGEVRPGPAV